MPSAAKFSNQRPSIISLSLEWAIAPVTVLPLASAAAAVGLVSGSGVGVDDRACTP